MDKIKDKRILIPLTFVYDGDNKIGYVIDAVSKDFYSLDKFILGEIRLSSFSLLVNMCINIVAIFKCVAENGLCFHDVTISNFLFDCKNGDVILGAVEQLVSIGYHPKIMC